MNADRVSGWLVALGLTLLGSAPARGQSAEEQAQQVALKSAVVQNRRYAPTSELTAWLGTMPLDAFVKGLTAGGSYTLHLGDLLGWEIAQFLYSQGVDTRLKAELENLNVGQTPFRTVRMALTSNVLLKPIYGKLSVLNSRVVYGELFVLGGGGVGWLTGGPRPELRPVLDAGLGLRLYLGDHVSLRLDLRDYAFVRLATPASASAVRARPVQNELWLGFGFCLGI